MNSVTASKSCAGYMLLEMLVYVPLFSVLAVMCTQLYINANRMHTYVTHSADRAGDMRDVQRAFLNAARNARGIAEGVGDHRTGAATLVLHAAEPGRYIVLGDLERQGRLSILEVIQEGDTFSAARYRTCRLPLSTIAFDVEPGAERIRMEVTALPVNPARPDAVMKRSFIAAPRLRTASPLSPEMQRARANIKNTGEVSHEQ